MFEPEGDGVDTPHVWMAFADLLAGVLGVFVLLFVWLVVFHSDLAGDLAQANAARAEAEAEQARLALERRLAAERAAALEAEKAAAKARVKGLQRALATPLGRHGVTLEDDGRIGITGAVLFDLYSADLRPDGRAVLAELGPPLAAWLAEHDELVMVAGFTDDLPIRGAEPDFRDNWQLSTERALTVLRALAEAGVPQGRLYAAGFGAHHPAVPNADDAARARNRRVEIVPQAREGQ